MSEGRKTLRGQREARAECSPFMECHAGAHKVSVSVRLKAPSSSVQPPTVAALQGTRARIATEAWRWMNTAFDHGCQELVVAGDGLPGPGSTRGCRGRAAWQAAHALPQLPAQNVHIALRPLIAGSCFSKATFLPRGGSFLPHVPTHVSVSHGGNLVACHKRTGQKRTSKGCLPERCAERGFKPQVTHSKDESKWGTLLPGFVGRLSLAGVAGHRPLTPRVSSSHAKSRIKP